MTTDEDRRRASATTAALSGCGGESAQPASAQSATSDAQAAVSSEWRMMTSQVTHRRPAARPARCPQECERSGASWLCVADFRRVCLAHPDTDGPPSACSGRREMCTCGVSAPADCPMRRTARAVPNDGRRQRGRAPPETSQASSLQLPDFQTRRWRRHPATRKPSLHRRPVSQPPVLQRAVHADHGREGPHENRDIAGE